MALSHARARLVALIIAARRSGPTAARRVVKLARAPFAARFAADRSNALPNAGDGEPRPVAMFEIDQTVPQDHRNYAEAVKWYRRSAEQGAAESQFNLGIMYETGRAVPQDYAEAMTWYRAAAAQGVAAAKNKLGLMYFKGTGVARDYAEAVRWCREAAEEGDVAAQNNLGFMYEKGLGVAQDHAAAIAWFLAAADQGDVAAQNNLGFAYVSGLGAPQDFVQAYMWFTLAAAQGNEASAKNRDTLAKRMTPADVSRAQQLARDWVAAHGD